MFLIKTSFSGQTHSNKTKIKDILYFILHQINLNSIGVWGKGIKERQLFVSAALGVSIF